MENPEDKQYTIIHLGGYHPAPLLRAQDQDAWELLNSEADIPEGQEQERADSIRERRNQEDDDR